ncbi:Tyrosine recombinase XerC [Halomonadaceae bacterium LMG 33818]|uniref:tyrosine-type recombinase/integrase n=1 Tax=Cernens ardua TaxID=3402176 RepID=UPI003EDBAAF4
MGRKKKHTFFDGVARWIDEYDVSSQIKHIRLACEYMGDKVMLDQGCVDKAREMARDMRKAGLSESTVNNRLQVVKRVLSLAYIEWEWLDKPLDGKIRKRNPKNERHVYLTIAEIARLLECFDDYYAIERTITGLAAITGLRQGELLKLEKSNISPGRIVLRPDQTKNGRMRAIPVPDDAMPWLMELPFQTTRDKLRWGFDKAREKAGMPHLHFHDLRHSYASMLAQSGESLTTVRDILGHSSLAVTSRYTHLFDERLDAVQKALPSLFSNQTATKGR